MEEAGVVVVVAVEEAVAVVGARGTLVLLVVACRFARRSLGSWCCYRLGCQVSVSCVVCDGSDAEGVLFLGV